ncbi:MAG: Cys-tRNA(Pro) deacylase, partial [Ignavibacteria bacterium]
GYLRGGCSPIGMKKHFPTFLEETAFLFDTISISPGQRGMQMLIAPNDLRIASQATISNLL